MPEFCTCGAQLPPDALFCHKCGKPQREIVEVEPAQAQPALAQPAFVESAPLPSVQPPLSFRDRVAVRTALVVALAATLVGFLVPFLNWLAAGFFAVLLYRRKTRRLVDVSAGVRLGWITGIVMFPIWAVAFALPEALSGRLGTEFQEQIRSHPAPDPAVQHQLVQFLQTGLGVSVVLLFILMIMFLVMLGLSMAGGALGAKVAGRDAPRGVPPPFR
jgi:hypothetical protein